MLAEVLKDVVHIAQLIKIEFTSGTEYMTDADQDIYYGSQWYTAYPITYDNFVLGQKPEESGFTLEIGNVKKKWSTLILLEEIRDKRVTISRILLGRNLEVIGIAYIIFLGYTDQGVIDKRVAKIEVYTQFIKWKTLTPRRIHQDTCTWKKFTGTECGYIDGTVGGDDSWCDRTYERCTVLTNTLNYGGFRFLKDLASKEVWWGRLQKYWANYPM